MNIARSAWEMTKETYKEWSNDRVSRLSASLAYYTVFCIAPLLVLAVRASALIFGQAAANNQLKGQLKGLLGEGVAGAVASMVGRAAKPNAGGRWETIFSIILFAYASTLLFDEFQDSMNAIWNVESKTSSSWWRTIRHQLASLAMVLGTIVLFMVSLLISTFLPTVNHYAKGGGAMLGRPVEVIVSLVIFTIVFAAAFKFLSAAHVAWIDAWIGATATSALFTMGKYAMSLYLARSSGMSIYGATGAVAVILIWVYYSAHVLFIGAEFTQVYAHRHGRTIEASKAVKNDRANNPDPTAV